MQVDSLPFLKEVVVLVGGHFHGRQLVKAWDSKRVCFPVYRGIGNIGQAVYEFSGAHDVDGSEIWRPV